jgi:hypothetical protein
MKSRYVCGHCGGDAIERSDRLARMLSDVAAVLEQDGIANDVQLERVRAVVTSEEVVLERVHENAVAAWREHARVRVTHPDADMRALARRVVALCDELEEKRESAR